MVLYSEERYVSEENVFFQLLSDIRKLYMALYMALYIVSKHEVTLKVLVTTIDAQGHFQRDNYSTVGGDGGCRVGEVRAGTTSPIPDHKGFKQQ